ncbi:MAG: UDP-N-acetylmuramoyl-L-alanyl-D-glutamate--2,6-diaminopimelate ligase [Bdellovibrionales bacterium]
MTFSNFLTDYFQTKTLKDFEIKSICTHSQKVKKGSLFVALAGRKEDGHSYIQEAIDQGAQALLVKDTSQIPSSFKGLILKSQNIREDLSRLLNEYHEDPSDQLFMIGVTGTNGKTTVSYMLEHILNHCGWPTGVIGTIDQHFQKQKWETSLTTPEVTETFERLHDFTKAGAKATVMEVSSIGLDQKRVDGLNFKAALFTNLSQDHLDYHFNLEDYFKVKQKLFLNSSDKNFFSIINQDDPYGKKLIQNVKTKVYTYGLEDTDFCFKIKDQNLSETVFDLKTPFGSTLVRLPLLGVYNVYNAVASLACATVIGFDLKDCQKALEDFQFPYGRLQKVTNPKDDFQVFVDYAHTPRALSSVLQTLKPYKKDKKLIVVFGCGGDRDKTKRVPMVQEATQHADQVFLTSDNPRFENPMDIIESSLKDVKSSLKKHLDIEVNREKAIEKAILFAQKGDIILIAGKGHEKIQIIRDEKRDFDDVQVAKKILKKKFQ